MGRGQRPELTTATAVRGRAPQLIHHFGTMSRVVKITRDGKSYAFKRDSGGHNGGNLRSAEEILRDRGVRHDHCAKAELMADRTIDLLGPPYNQRIARVQATEHGGQPGLLIDWVEGNSYRKQSLTGDRYLNQALFCRPEDSSLSAKEWLEKAREMIFVDTLIGNSDRHGDNIIVTDKGPIGIDQGLAFVPEKKAPTKPRPQNPGVASDQAVHLSGGPRLTDQEYQACQRLKEAGWPQMVGDSLGRAAGQEAEKRLNYMLDRRTLHPYITGTDIKTRDPAIPELIKQEIEQQLAGE